MLSEFTSMDFEISKEENAAKTFKLLDNIGWFKGLGKTNKKAKQHLQQFVGGKMFVHIAAHKGYVDNFGDLKGFPKGDTDISLHRREFWLRSDKVDVTYLSVSVNGKGIGGVYVDTDVFLKMLKKANSEGFND